MTDTADTGEPRQEATLAFLDEKVRQEAAKRIDTHASIVFLEPDRVLKIKRAVRLPFLDYSTLAKRKCACEDELAINRRYAPALYRRVVPITRGAEGPEIDGGGCVIEWAVEMARFDEARTLDHLARAGKIEPGLGEAVADVIGNAHAEAEISDGSTWLASIAGIIDRNIQKFRGEASLSRDAVEQLHALSHRRLSDNLPLLQRRVSLGQVRRCHGDAHLGNIVMIDDKPVLFDAIEFDPAIATTDVLYDLAFPLMDLIHFGLNAAANRLFNRYLQRNWDECAGALRLLPLFLSMRAAIRSHVAFTKCEQQGGDAEEAAQAKTYFDLALQLLQPSHPTMIAIGGMSGTGKSALARELAGQIPPQPGAVVLRSDVIRKELFGVDPLVALPQAAYGADVTARVYRILLERARPILDQRFSVIIDAAFLREAERDEIAAEARKMAADFRPIFLAADLALRLERVGSRKNDASDAIRGIATLQESYDLGRIEWPTVDASGSPHETLERSLVLLGKGQHHA